MHCGTDDDDDVTPESCHLYASGFTVKGLVRCSLLLCISYPFIMSEGSSVSTQAAELTKRFSGGRAVLFPATFLKTSVITYGHNNKTKQKKTLMSWDRKSLWPEKNSHSQ